MAGERVKVRGVSGASLTERLWSAMDELERLRHDLALATARMAHRRVRRVEATEDAGAAEDYLRAYT